MADQRSAEARRLLSEALDLLATTPISHLHLAIAVNQATPKLRRAHGLLVELDQNQPATRPGGEDPT